MRTLWCSGGVQMALKQFWERNFLYFLLKDNKDTQRGWMHFLKVYESLAKPIPDLTCHGLWQFGNFLSALLFAGARHKKLVTKHNRNLVNYWWQKTTKFHWVEKWKNWKISEKVNNVSSSRSKVWCSCRSTITPSFVLLLPWPCLNERSSLPAVWISSQEDSLRL